MIVAVKPGNRDLYSAADQKSQPPGDWKRPCHECRRQEHLALRCQHAAGPECGILIDHRPEYVLDPIIHGSVKNGRPAEDIRSAGGKVGADRGLNVPSTEPLSDTERGRQDGMPDAIW